MNACENSCFFTKVPGNGGGCFPGSYSVMIMRGEEVIAL